MTDTDWNEVWTEKMRKNQESYLNIHWSQRWNDDQSAKKYDTQAHEMRDHFLTLADGMVTDPTDHILEIGPGPGSLTIPLSKRVAQVTVIEPSPFMRKVLEHHLEEHHITNVSIIGKRWEEIDPDTDLGGRYNLVCASHSLGMNDLKTSLEKMDAVSSGYVYLFWFSRSSFLEQSYIRLWPSLHGKEYHPLPKTDVIHQILLQMGIHPEIEEYEVESCFHYSSIEEAIAEYAMKFGCRDKVIPPCIQDVVRNNWSEKEHVVRMGGTSSNAKIWWNKNHISLIPEYGDK